ncbi:hypothetical protein LWF15_17290 [Kineosporia rhizophila]|uniref:hypothetical protein n=1 Tax=Kineosporia rhizophila TaxID=84633 RepID=UPI001E5BDF03|nr:hypothetical protein [Kineosporia rhizophila]MCE0537258.1 hypothetical protein [Kineosporia rhizophila]
MEAIPGFWGVWGIWAGSGSSVGSPGSGVRVGKKIQNWGRSGRAWAVSGLPGARVSRVCGDDEVVREVRGAPFRVVRGRAVARCDVVARPGVSGAAWLSRLRLVAASVLIELGVVLTGVCSVGSRPGAVGSGPGVVPGRLCAASG